MTFIEGKARSLWKKIFSTGAIFLGFLGTFVVAAPRVTTHSSLPALSETSVTLSTGNVAFADAPPYSTGGDDDDDDCGDSSGGDSSGDDGG